MKKSVKITITLMIVISFSLLLSRLNLSSCQSTTLKIVDAVTGSPSITLGSEIEPIPKEGIPFTLKIVLEGGVTNLYSFQVGIAYNPTAINYTKAWFPKNDPDYIFYGKTSFESPIDIVHISNELDEIVMGAMLLEDPSKAVTTDKGVLCMINFTAKKAGACAINFINIGMDTFLLDNNALDIPFQTQGFSLTVFGSNTPLAYFTWTPLYPHANETVIFNASGSYDPDGYIVSYIWDFGDGVINETSDSIITHNFTKNGIYNVNLTVIDDSGLSDFLVQSVMVGRSPILILEPISPKYNLTETVIFNASGSYDPDGYIVSYIWDFGDGVVNETTDPIFNKRYEKRGIYKISITIVDNDGLSNSTSLTVQIGNSPIANFTYDPKNPMVGDIVRFDATGTQIPDGVSIKTFVWFCDERYETITSDSPFMEYVFLSDSGSRGFNVTLTVYDQDGLYDSCSALIIVTAISTQKSGFGIEIPIIVTVAVIIIAAVIIKRKSSQREEVLEI